MAAPPRFQPLARVVGTFFGTGHAPMASGTVATAAAVPFYLAMVYLPPEGMATPLLAAATLVSTAAGVWAAGALERILGVHDPSEVVIDEVAGFFLTMLLVPPGVATIACGFLLFRVFDILKPWPAGPAEKMGGGWGIMADDLICGLYANIILQIGVRLLS